MDAAGVETFWRDGCANLCLHVSAVTVHCSARTRALLAHSLALRYVILRGLLDPAVYEPVRSLIERTAQAKFRSQVLPLRPCADPHEGAPVEERWARVAQELIADTGVDSGRANTVVKAGTWGRHDMLDPCVHELLVRV